MPRKWQLQEAKNRFSEMVADALQVGPQVVTRHGEETVVVLSIKDYKKLRKPKENLFEFLHNSPLKGVELDLERSKDLPRDISL